MSRAGEKKNTLQQANIQTTIIFSYIFFFFYSLHAMQIRWDIFHVFWFKLVIFATAYLFSILLNVCILKKIIL